MNGHAPIWFIGWIAMVVILAGATKTLREKTLIWFQLGWFITYVVIFVFLS